MHVLYLIPGLGGGGGAERSLLSMTPHLTAEIDLSVATFSDRGELAGALTDAGANHLPLGTGSRMATAGAFSALLRSTRPDLVHTTLYDADVIGRVVSAGHRTPVVSSLVNDRYSTAPGFARTVTKAVTWAVDAASAQLATRFHALTEHVATTLSRRLRVPLERIDVIPRGRGPAEIGDRSAAHRREVRTRLGLDATTPVVIATARHEHQKGLDVLVRAAPSVARSVPGVRVLIGGREGQATPELRRLVREAGVEHVVDFIGPRSDVPDLMAAADVWCVPSRWEGMGSILVEAMATGVPTVASAIPPILETAGNPSWLLAAAPGDPSELASAIVETLADHAASIGRAARGRQRYEEAYTAEAVSRAMLSFYERALQGSRWPARP